MTSPTPASPSAPRSRVQTPASRAVKAAQARPDPRPHQVRAGRLPVPTVPSAEEQAAWTSGKLRYRLLHAGLRPPLVAFALELLGRCDWKKQCWRVPAKENEGKPGISMRTMGQILGVARGTAQGYRRQLEQLGVIATLDRRPRVNAYWLLPDGIEALFQRQKAHIQAIAAERKRLWEEEEQAELDALEVPPAVGSAAPVPGLPSGPSPVEQLARAIALIVHGEKARDTLIDDRTLDRVEHLFAALRNQGSGWDEARLLGAVRALVLALEGGSRAQELRGMRRTVTSMLNFPHFIERVRAARAWLKERADATAAATPDGAPTWDAADTAAALEKARARWAEAGASLEAESPAAWRLWLAHLTLEGVTEDGVLQLRARSPEERLAVDRMRHTVEAQAGPIELLASPSR